MSIYTIEALETRKKVIEGEIVALDAERELLCAKRNMLTGALLEITDWINGDIDTDKGPF